MSHRRLLKLVSLAILTVFLVCVAGCTPVSTGEQDASLSDAAAVDSGADTGADVAPAYPKVGIATFNVRLFFDTVCNSSRCAPDDFENVPTQADFEARADELAAAIEGLDIDIVLLQEIENQTALDALQSALGGGFPVAVIGESGWGGSIDVAVLAKGALDETYGYREDNALERPDGSRTDFAREFLRVDLDIDGEEVIVFTAHFTSKSGTDDPGRRLAEARAARQIVEDVAASNDDALVVFGGDLNDTPDSEPLEALTADGGFLRVAAEKSLDETFTYVYRRQAESIDHLLWAPTLGGAYVPDSVRSVHDRSPAGYGGSDHGALVAEFEMR